MQLEAGNRKLKRSCSLTIKSYVKPAFILIGIGIVGSTNRLTFQKQELDLIWSEGAIYNIGFERGGFKVAIQTQHSG